MSNIVALVGRPNVGKSTLFNRLTQSKDAIVDPTSGVTRDRHYGKSDWNGKEFSIIDTGGYIIGSDDVFEEEIRKQVQLAIEEADSIVFLVDVNEGLSPMDEDVAKLLRRSKKPVFVVANKSDNAIKSAESAVFYGMGLGKIYPVSSINGSGTGEFLDDLVSSFADNKEEEELDLPKFAVVGRPNVGKSSLVNALIGNERSIVTNVAGTTRDSIYTRYNAFGFDFFLVDTAGLRKKGKVNENIEFYSTLRSVRSIESADVCILMVDATEGIQAQDLNILSLITRNNKGVVILINKWDLVEKGNNTMKTFESQLKERIAPFTDVPIIFTSVISKQRIFKAMETAVEVYQNKSRRIITSQLNEFFQPLIENYPPPATKGKYVKIKYITQLPLKYPSFVFFCNLPQYVKEPYKRFLENKLRENYNFSGVPIKIYFRQK